MSEKQLHKSFKFPEPIYYIDSGHISDDISYISDNRIFSIGINPFKGYKIKDINGLLPLRRDIKRFSIECRKMNLDNIQEFKNLEFLYIIEDNCNINLSQLTSLKMLNITYDKSIEGLENLIALKELVLSNANAKIFKDIISSYEYLERLKITESKLPKDFSFLNGLNKLSTLEFLYCGASVIDILQLLPIKNNLKVLRLENCKKIENIEKLEEFENLEELYLINSAPLPSSKFITQLTKLKSLVVMGTSYFIDGDISNLMSHIRLSHVGIDDKRHYSHKYEYIKEKIDDKLE